jgi:prepilin-type N-terminal cleavage/methylation domain-containing protein
MEVLKVKFFKKQKKDNMYTKNITTQKGFTLIELMVATSIFMMVMLMAMGSLIVSSNAAKKSQSLRLTMDNVNFALETMTRSLRTGTNYSCVYSGGSIDLSTTPPPSDCPLESNKPGSLVAFVPAVTDPNNPPLPLAYQKVARPSGGTSTLQRCDQNGCTDIVSAQVDVEDLRFYVDGSRPDDFIQPKVYIMMRGTVLIKGEPTSFAVQTIASQRSGE